jgi:hypothetical protein
MRVCKYTVVSEYTGPLPDDFHGDCDDCDCDCDDYDDEQDYFVAEEMCTDDIVTGMDIAFNYTKADNITSRRYLQVEELVDNRYVRGLLLSPEEHAGEWRQFITNNMSDIEELI